MTVGYMRSDVLVGEIWNSTSQLPYYFGHLLSLLSATGILYLTACEAEF